MKRGMGGLLMVASGLAAAGCGAPVPVGVSGQGGDRQVAVGPMGGDTMSQPATPPTGGTASGPMPGSFSPGAAWSQGGSWPGVPYGYPPGYQPPVMRAGPGLPADYPEYRHSPYYPSTPYDVWRFWETAQHTNPFFHHRYRYPELPHTPRGPLQWGAPGYPGGPPMGPGFGR